MAQTHFPATIQLGDMLRWRDWQIDWASIDLLFSGTPCQSFSTLGRRDFSGANLLSAAFDIYEHCARKRRAAGLPPPHVLGENVIGAAKHIAAENANRSLPLSLNKIDSRDCSATRRPRCYCTALPPPAPSPTTPRAISEAVPRAILDAAPHLPAHMSVRKTASKWLFAASEDRAGRRANMRGSTGILWTGQIWDISEPSYCLTHTCLSMAFGHPDGTIRRATPELCEALMGLPPNYTQPATTRTARALAVANAWQIDTVAAILAPLASC